MSEQKANPKANPPFILASASARRRELLAELLHDYEVTVAEVEELSSHPDGPTSLVMENARLKARAIAEQRPEAWVLGADTIVTLGDEVFGKPADLVEATVMLRRLSGKTHEVRTGLCLVRLVGAYEETRVETSQVTFRELDDGIIDEYFAEVNPLDKAGGYAIQIRGELIVEDFEGSRSNVIGLPLELLREWLDSLGLAG
ncbi:MAG: Maf family protein [Opitutales bacterium]